MIRLTELERQDGVVRVRLEGSLSADGMRVLGAALADLRAKGLGTVVVEGDGISFIDRLSMRDWHAVIPKGMTVRLTTTRRSLHQLLSSYGVTAELVPPKGGGEHPPEETSG